MQYDPVGADDPRVMKTQALLVETFEGLSKGRANVHARTLVDAPESGKHLFRNNIKDERTCLHKIQKAMDEAMKAANGLSPVSEGALENALHDAHFCNKTNRAADELRAPLTCDELAATIELWKVALQQAGKVVSAMEPHHGRRVDAISLVVSACEIWLRFDPNKRLPSRKNNTKLGRFLDNIFETVGVQANVTNAYEKMLMLSDEDLYALSGQYGLVRSGRKKT